MLQGPLLGVDPTRATRFRSPLVLSRVHWVRPELVVEVTYPTCTDDGLLRQVVYEGLREDKPAPDVACPLAATELAAGRKFQPFGQTKVAAEKQIRAPQPASSIRPAAARNPPGLRSSGQGRAARHSLNAKAKDTQRLARRLGRRSAASPR